MIKASVRYQRVFLWLLAFVLAVSWVLPTGGTARATNRIKPGFCAQSILTDFTVDLNELPAINEIPLSGQLPFSPGVLIKKFSSPPNRDGLIAGAGGFGYVISSGDSAQVNWEIESDLFRIDKAGENVRSVDHAQGIVTEVSSRSILEFLLSTPSSAGRYRYDMTIKDSGGSPLARYSSYIRIVKGRLATSLGIERRTVDPGGTIRIRVENRGTLGIEYTTAARIQRQVAHGKWATVFTAGSQLPFPAARSLGGGEVGKCEAVRIPKDLERGIYRVTKEVAKDRHSPNPGHGYIRQVVFNVL